MNLEDRLNFSHDQLSFYFVKYHRAKTHMSASTVSNGAALWPRLVRAAMIALILFIVACGLVLAA